jgi:hypothetical protein
MANDTTRSDAKQQPTRVFISYRHEPERPEHADRVLELANRLRAQGIDASLDQYEQSPPSGWPTWCEFEIKHADFVLMICTEAYYRCIEEREEVDPGHGVLWEARIIRQLLYEAGAKTAKVIPVLFGEGKVDYIPLPVKGATYYIVDTEQGFENLYRLLTNQPRTRKPELGEVRNLPERARQWREQPPAEDATRRDVPLVRIFLSSPGDVAEERSLALQLIDSVLPKLPHLRERVHLQLIAWDDPAAQIPMLATETPQESVNAARLRPATCDIVLVVLWSRMGTPLPDSVRKPSRKPYLSGTEWEYEDAVNSPQQPRPDVLIYRRTEEPKIGLRDPQKKEKGNCPG